MKKGWKVITAIVFAAILLGGVLIGVGLLTGAEFDRIYLTLDQRYQITAYLNWLREAVVVIGQQL